MLVPAAFAVVSSHSSFKEGLKSGRRQIVKIIAESLSQHDEKHVVPTPLSGIRVGEREDAYCAKKIATSSNNIN
jgi:hypothetical protein